MNFVFEREIDRTGRIVIPIDIRKHLCISEESALIITVEDDKI